MQHPAEDRKKMLHQERVDLGRVEAFGYDSQPSQPWDMICCQVHDPLTFFGVLTSIVIGGLALGFGIAGFTQAHNNADKIASLEAAPPPPAMGGQCCFNPMKLSAAAYSLSTLSTSPEAVYADPYGTAVGSQAAYGSDDYNVLANPASPFGKMGLTYGIAPYGGYPYTSNPASAAFKDSDTVQLGINAYAANTGKTKALVNGADKAASHSNGDSPVFGNIVWGRGGSRFATLQAAGGTAAEYPTLFATNPTYLENGGTMNYPSTLVMKMVDLTAGSGANPVYTASTPAAASYYNVPFNVMHQCMADGRIAAVHSLLFSQATPNVQLSTAALSDIPDLSSYTALNDLYHTRYLDATCA